MSDQEIDKQITDASKKASLLISTREDSIIHNTYGVGYWDGATAQDKIATNRTVEEAIKILNLYAWMLDTNEDRDTLIKELEKLRR